METLQLQEGKVTINTQGLLTAPQIKTTKLTITNPADASGSATLGTSIGSSTLPANNTKVTIYTKEATSSAKVFITPTTPTDKVLSATNIIGGKSFDVSILSPSLVDVIFNWWIVQTE